MKLPFHLIFNPLVILLGLVVLFFITYFLHDLYFFLPLTMVAMMVIILVLYVIAESKEIGK